MSDVTNSILKSSDKFSLKQDMKKLRQEYESLLTEVEKVLEPFDYQARHYHRKRVNENFCESCGEHVPCSYMKVSELLTKLRSRR